MDWTLHRLNRSRDLKLEWLKGLLTQDSRRDGSRMDVMLDKLNRFRDSELDWTLGWLNRSRGLTSEWLKVLPTKDSRLDWWDRLLRLVMTLDWKNRGSGGLFEERVQFR